MSEIKTIKQAKEFSYNKWNSILNILDRINHLKGNMCGFCLLAETIKGGILHRCDSCLIPDECRKFLHEYDEAFYKLIEKNMEILTFIKDFKEES